MKVKVKAEAEVGESKHRCCTTMSLLQNRPIAARSLAGPPQRPPLGRGVGAHGQWR